MNLEETLQLLTKYRVARFKGYIDAPRVADQQIPVELDISPLAFTQLTDGGPSMPKQGAFTDADGSGMCRCGHALTDHGEHGLCLRGCGDDACELVTDGNGKTTAGP